MVQPTAPDVSHRPVPSTRAGLARWLLELGADIGRPLDGDRTLVPLTVTELNIRTGRSPKCGTLFGRVKALAPAVTLHRGGITIDRSGLEREAAGVTAPRTGDRPRPATPSPSPSPSPTAAAGERARTIELLQEACRVAEQAAALAATAARLATEACALAADTEGPATTAADARDRGAAAGRGSRDRGLSPEEGGREVSSCSQTQTPPSLTALPRLAEAAATPAIDPAPSVPRDDLDELLRPLVETCRRTGLVAVSDTRGLRAALAPYSADQIRHAVVLTSRLTRSGVITSRPIGWLIARARNGDLDYFPPAEPAAATPPPPAASHPSQTDLEMAKAERALATADADELAALDDWIRAAPHHARIRHLIFEPGRDEMLQTARLEAWRTLQEKAS